MGIDIAHYHGWHGPLRSPWFSAMAIVRVALMQVFRRKSYWIVLALGLLNFLLFWSIVYGVTQFGLPRQAQQALLEEFGFSSQPEDVMQSGYFRFMQQQNIVVMILLAFSGSLLVGSDFRHHALPFYLSRRIDRRHYIVGKLLAVSSVIAILTVLPALALFVEYGMFTSSVEYWMNNWRVPVAVVLYGMVICTVLSILLVTLAAYLQRTAPIAITWASLFVLLGTLSGALRNNGSAYWSLIDPWRNMRSVGRLIFGTRFETTEERWIAFSALAILVAICCLALAALVRRVRAVDVVK